VCAVLVPSEHLTSAHGRHEQLFASEHASTSTSAWPIFGAERQRSAGDRCSALGSAARRGKSTRKSHAIGARKPEAACFSRPRPCQSQCSGSCLTFYARIVLCSLMSRCLVSLPESSRGIGQIAGPKFEMLVQKKGSTKLGFLTPKNTDVSTILRQTK